MPSFFGSGVGLVGGRGSGVGSFLRRVGGGSGGVGGRFRGGSGGGVGRFGHGGAGLGSGFARGGAQNAEILAKNRGQRFPHPVVVVDDEERLPAVWHGGGSMIAP